jgi:hypothetical protein
MGKIVIIGLLLVWTSGPANAEHILVGNGNLGSRSCTEVMRDEQSEITEPKHFWHMLYAQWLTGFVNGLKAGNPAFDDGLPGDADDYYEWLVADAMAQCVFAPNDTFQSAAIKAITAKKDHSGPLGKK